mmetsp:Transcript_14859/g.26701  ORF Transcript_14859/g.26701 Transcript_14859/m.26701 type:complete len:201 (+) Transcript_14859:479-1081(+)
MRQRTLEQISSLHELHTLEVLVRDLNRFLPAVLEAPRRVRNGYGVGAWDDAFECEGAVCLRRGLDLRRTLELRAKRHGQSGAFTRGLQAGDLAGNLDSRLREIRIEHRLLVDLDLPGGRREHDARCPLRLGDGRADHVASLRHREAEFTFRVGFGRQSQALRSRELNRPALQRSGVADVRHTADVVLDQLDLGESGVRGG